MVLDQVLEMLSALQDVYHSRILACVGLTLAIYDWILVIPDVRRLTRAIELETIFQAGARLPQVLYYYMRIITPLGILLCTYRNYRIYDHPSPTPCVLWLILAVFAMITSIGAANGLLALRLLALYRRQKAVIWFISCFYVISYGATFGIAIQSLIFYSESFFYSDILGVCGTHRVSVVFPAVFYGPAAFEFFVFALTAWRGLRDARIITGTGSAPLLMILYRDGFICFFVMIALRAWNIWIYMTQPLSDFTLGTQLMWAANTILTTRVYMNLVWIAKRPVEASNVGSRVLARTGTCTASQNQRHAAGEPNYATASWEPWGSRSIQADSAPGSTVSVLLRSSRIDIRDTLL